MSQDAYNQASNPSPDYVVYTVYSGGRPSSKTVKGYLRDTQRTIKVAGPGSWHRHEVRALHGQKARRIAVKERIAMEQENQGCS